MKVFKTIAQLNIYVAGIKQSKLKIGFVATMGALHSGHLSLLEASKKVCDVTIASIFVNPTQFNNLEDLKKYPKPIESDIVLLQSIYCDALFIPDLIEMYPPNDNKWIYEIGYLNTILEGSFRPGHYLGVTQIVFKLFNLVKPNVAFFGQKDYQQFLVIKQMVKDFNLPVEVIASPIVRENNGLALSSRNSRLNQTDLKNSLIIFKSLSFIKNNFSKKDVNVLVQEVKNMFQNTEGVLLEYLEIRQKETLKPYEKNSEAIALIACQVGETRLIDNMMLS